MDSKEGAQRFMNFYNGTYPSVSLGANGFAIYNEELGLVGNVSTVKNNYSIGNTNEEVNDVITFLGDSLIVTEEGANGLMFKYIKDKDITNTDNIINAGGITFEGSPNAVISYKHHLIMTSETSGTTTIKTAYYGDYFSTYKDYTPTYKMEIDQTKTQHVVPNKNYKGMIASKGHSFFVKGNRRFPRRNNYGRR
ncbi:MAG: hypothetical protein ACK5MI_08875 [Mangrovibacterium sp.]